MKERIAIRSATTVIDAVSSSPSLSFLKQDALMFDRIFIAHSGAIFKLLKYRNAELAKYLAGEFDWLVENGIVLKPDEELINNYLAMEDEREDGSEQRRMIGDLLWTEYGLNYFALHKREKLLKIMKAYFDFSMKILDIKAAQKSLGLRLKGVSACPVISDRVFSKRGYPAKKENVAHIILHQLPIPSELTPWESILDFRHDSETAGKLLALRNWMNEVARAELPPNEIEEKLEWLIYDYKQHLDLHRMKINTTTLEAVVIATAEMFEHLVKFEFGKLAKGLFSLKHRRLDLIEGELNAPGREVAYIAKAKEKFP